MSGNRSLDEFADAESGDGDGDDATVLEGTSEDAVVAETADDDVAEAADEAVAEPAVEAGRTDDAPNADEDADCGGDGAATRDATATSDGAPDTHDGADATPDTSPEGAGEDPGGASPDSEELDPPASTYVWSPGGGTCADCGATVEERWRAGTDLVCAGCKEW